MVGLMMEHLVRRMDYGRSGNTYRNKANDTINGSLISKTKTGGKHTHKELSGSEDGAHSHSLETFTVRDGVLVIHNALKKGDTVYLLSFNSGKQYYILDRKG